MCVISCAFRAQHPRCSVYRRYPSTELQSKEHSEWICMSSMNIIIFTLKCKLYQNLTDFIKYLFLYLIQYCSCNYYSEPCMISADRDLSVSPLPLRQFRDSASLGDGFSFQSIVSRPRSSGTVELHSSDPFQKPDIRTGVALSCCAV